jgi:hypothetical protein
MLDNIVRINISTQSLSMAQKGFGVPLIIGDFYDDDPSRVLIVKDISEVPQESEIVYKIASAILSQSPKVQKLKIGKRFTGEDILKSFHAICDADSDFYGVLLANPTEKDILDLAEIVSQKRILLGLDLDDKLLPVAKILKDKNYKNIFAAYKPNMSEYPSAAFMGKMLPKAPGSATWAFQQLTGISKANIGTNLIENLKNQNINYYINIADIGVTLDGKTLSGEYIDVICGIDWLYARLQERLFRLFMLNEKIPYTLKGIDLMRSEIIAQLKEAVYQGVLSPEPEPEVSTPTIEDIDVSDRQKRILPKVKFSGRLAGAIHELEIHGTVGP